MRQILLRDRLMVGHIPLEDGILVRVQVPQQFRSEQTQNFPTTTFARPAPLQAGLGSLLRPAVAGRSGAK